jgi:thymidylate kinase
MQIFFLDGPNGAGKDYIVDELAPYLNKLHSDWVYVNMKGYMPTDITNNRYRNVKTDLRALDKILYGHMCSLQDIKTNYGDKTVVLVNRSIYSFIVYNLITSDLTEQEYKYYINEINTKYNAILPVSIRNLILLGISIPTKTLVERIFTRDKIRPAVPHVEEVVSNYKFVHKTYHRLFNSALITESDKVNSIVTNMWHILSQNSSSQTKT